VTFHTLMPGAFGKAGNPLTVRKLAGAWFIRQPATIDGVVVDERRGLGTARPVQPRRAMLLNGTNQKVTYNLPTPMAYPWSVFGVFDVVTATNGMALLSIQGASSGTYSSLRISSDTSLGLHNNDVNGGQASTINVFPAVTNIATRGWMSVVLVFHSATSASLYLDGALVGTIAITSFLMNSTFNRFTVGALSSAAGYANTYAQHCGYTRTAATLADVLAFHQTGIMPNAEELFPLDDNSTTVARDIITGAEATIVNGAAGMLYTGRDVPFSRQNSVGYSTRRNLLTFSDQFNLWTSAGANVTANTHIGPDGRLTADTVNRPGNSTYTITRIVTLVAGETYCWSIWAKAGSNNKLTIMVYNTSSGERMLTGTKISGSGSISTSNYSVISGLDNEWSHFKVTFTAGSTGSGVHTFYIYPVTSAGIGNMESGTVILANSMLNTGASPLEYQSIGTDPGSSVLFPAILNGTTSAAGDTLQFSGPAPMNGQVQASNCLTFDGTDDYIAMDLNAVAGSELVTNGNFTTWTNVNANLTNKTSNSWDATTTGGSGVIPPTNLMTVGKAYLIKISATGPVGGSFGIRDVTTTNQLIPDKTMTGSPVELTGVHVRNSTSNFFLRSGSVIGTFTVHSISIKELPTVPRATIITNGTFDTDTIWTKGTGWTIGSGVATFAATGSSSNLDQAATLLVGQSYLLTYTLTQSAGNFNTSLSGGTPVTGPNRTSSGTYVEVLTAVSGNNNLRITAGSTFAGTIDNVTLQPITVQSQGTSLVTYRSQGDGITGTAGTAYDIRLGDVGWIPCSEGHGDQVHDVLRDEALQIVNGQFSNWGTTQNTFFYNLKEGNNVVNADTVDANPLVEFTGATQGVWFDPSDISTLFQDAAGTIPVTTYGDRVRLQLDKSKGLVLGPELVTNGGFDSNITGWTAIGGATNVWSSGTATSNYSFSAGGLFQDITTSANTVKVTVRAKSLGGSPLIWGIPRTGNFDSPNTIINVSGSEYVDYTFLVTRASGATGVRIYLNAGSSAGGIQVDSVSVKELPGYHKVFPSDAARAYYGRMPKVGVRNLLTRNTEYSNAAWTKTTGTVPDNVTLTEPGGGRAEIAQAFPVVSGTSYTLSVLAKENPLSAKRYISLATSSVGFTNQSVAIFDLATGTKTYDNGNGSNYTITAADDGYWRITNTDVATSTTTSGFLIYTTNTPSAITSSGGGSILLGGSQVETGTTATDLQTITNIDDVTQEGQDDCYYLRTAGAQSASTPAINFSYTDKMTVIAGVRKTSDAALAVVIEHSANQESNNGTFSLFAPALVGTLGLNGFYSKGTTLTGATAVLAATSSAVYSGQGDISGDVVRLRTNGVQAAETLTDQGTGNYGNYPLYFYARGGSSKYLTGFDFGQLIFGKAMSTYSIQKYENLIATNTPVPEPNITAPLRIPASQLNPGFDVLGDPLEFPAVIGHNGAESTINFSPVANSWPDTYSIPGADLPNYAFDGDPGDINILINTPTREAKFRLENQ
jgi:hypothetical protein